MVWRALDFILSVLSGEFLLKARPNGGTAILVRSLWVTVFIYGSAVAVKGILQTGFGLSIDGRAFWGVVDETLPWAGAIFAAAYAALYTRFSSQWTYLAGVYYQYMSTRAQAPIDGDAEREAIYNAWEAAIIEDAEDLHLATKPMFSHLILDCLTNDGVRNAFVDSSAGGTQRLEALIAQLELATGQTLTGIRQQKETRRLEAERSVAAVQSANSKEDPPQAP